MPATAVMISKIIIPSVPRKIPGAKCPMLPGWVRRCICLGSLANHPDVTRSAIMEPMSGVHHQRAANATIAATAMKKTGPGGNFGYAGSPDSHRVQIASAQATRPATVNLVGNVRLDRLVFIGAFPPERLSDYWVGNRKNAFRLWALSDQG